MCRVGNSASVLWALPGASELSRENSQPLSVVATDARSHGYAVFIQCRTLDVRRIPGGRWEVVRRELGVLRRQQGERLSGRAADEHTVHTYMGTLQGRPSRGGALLQRRGRDEPCRGVGRASGGGWV